MGQHTDPVQKSSIYLPSLHVAALLTGSRKTQGKPLITMDSRTEILAGGARTLTKEQLRMVNSIPTTVSPIRFSDIMV